MTLYDGQINGNNATGLVGGSLTYTVVIPDINVPDIIETADVNGTFEANFIGAAGEALSGTLSGSATRLVSGVPTNVAFGGALLAER